MPKILSINQFGNIPQDNPLQNFFDWFASQDRFTKMVFVVLFFLLLVTPFIISTVFQLKQHATGEQTKLYFTQNEQTTPLTSLTLATNQTVTLNLYLTTPQSLPINGFDISIVVPNDNTLQLIPPGTTEGIDAGKFNNVLFPVTKWQNNSVRFSKVITNFQQNPHGIFGTFLLASIPLQAVREGSGTIQFPSVVLSSPTSDTAVPVSKQEFTYTISGVSTTPTPTPSNHLVGDIDNNGCLDIRDFNLWEKAYQAGQTTGAADINNDNNIDLIDFNLWYKALQGNIGEECTSSLTPSPSPSPTLPLLDQSFFNRKDILYSSEIGSWPMQDGRYDGHYMLNYNNSCPNCSVLAKDAKIPVVRWAVWDTFPEQTNPAGKPGTMVRAQFDTVINGIRNTLGAYPFIKLQPITPSTTNNFCPEAWGVSNLIQMDKNIIQQAGNRVQLYEIANEMENDCGYSLDETGTKAGQYWIQVVPVLKKYARSLGFEIYIGGAAFMTSNINAGTDSPDLKKAQDFNQVIKNEYERVGSPYYHDPDLIPSFFTFHAYGVEYVNMVRGTSTPLDAIPHYGAYIDGVRSAITSIWGSTVGQTIKIVCSEWNVEAENGAFESPLSENYYTQFLQMLRSKDVFMANQFLMASNGNKMDMITEIGQATAYYNAFKQASLTDPLAISSRK